MNDNKHSIQLDGLRFFAVLAVMIGHWVQWQWTDPVLLKIPFVHGVTLFFVLSGFLITRILLQNKDSLADAGLSKGHLLKNFYIRRALRIFPPYYLLLFFLFAINYKNTRALFPWLITYTSNIYQSIHNVYVEDFNHLWSLAVEEQFYIFWPLLILFVPDKRILSTICVAIVASLLCKAYLFFFVGKWMATTYFTLSCMYALALGALLAYVVLYQQKVIAYISKPIWLYRAIVLYILTSILLCYCPIDWFKDIFDDFMFSIVAALIILRASTDSFQWIPKFFLENNFVVYSGKISYGLYLYHLFVPTFFYTVVSPLLGINISNKYTYFITFYFVTFALAHFSWVLIEKPISRLKTKIPYLK